MNFEFGTGKTGFTHMAGATPITISSVKVMVSSRAMEHLTATDVAKMVERLGDDFEFSNVRGSLGLIPF